MTQTQKYILFGVLGASLTLNLVVVGTVGWFAAEWRFGDHEHGPGRALARIENEMVEQLPRQDEAAVRAIFDRRRSPIRQSMQQFWSEREPLAALLLQDEVNAEELEALLARSRTAAGTFNEEFHGLVYDLALALSLEARTEIAEEFQERRERRDRRRSRRNSRNN